jgi:hypothetical protein
MKPKQSYFIALSFLIFFNQSDKSYGQNYLNVLNLNYSQASPSTDSASSSSFGSANLFIPIVYNKVKGHAITFGVNANSFRIYNDLQDDYNFYNLTLPIGLHYNFNSKWTGDFTVLNRLNSNFDPIKTSDYQFGLISTLSVRKNDDLAYKFGFYFNTELSGPLVVPFFGVNWQINEKAQLFGTLPRDATFHYRLNQKFAWGASFSGQVATYKLHSPTKETYVQRAKNEVGLFADFYLTDEIVFQIQGGYLIGTVYKEFYQGDQADWALSLVRFGDDRKELNRVKSDGVFGKISLMYRIDLTKL